MFGSKPVLIASTLSALLLTPGVSQAKDREPIVLSPAGPWQLDMAEHKCRIARLFGEGDQETVFYLEQWDPSRSAYWNVAGPPLEKYKAWRDTRFAFGPAGDEDEFEFVPSTLGDYGAAIGRSSTIVAHEQPHPDEEERDYVTDPRGLQALDSEGATDIETLTLSQKARSDVVLELGSMAAPLSAMNTCMKNLVEYWGFDVAQQETVQTPPKVGNLMRVAREIQEHYPNDALRRGGQADFHLRLTVDEAGGIEECILLNQTLADDFDMRKHPCTAFKKYAEVEPARNAAGEPVRTYYTSRIVYRIGG